MASTAIDADLGNLHIGPGDEQTPASYLDTNAELKATINDLIKRCRALNEELDTYVAAVENNEKLAKLQNPVNYGTIKNDFRAELAFLQKIVTSNLSEEKARHYIVSSNLVYYEALWAAAKRSSGLLNFRKYFFWSRKREVSLRQGSNVKGKAALVDIVASDGTEWVRVSTISEKRLLFDLAKLGWHNDSDDEDEEMTDVQSSNWEDDDDEDQVEIVRNARDLARAAMANPIRGRPPKVHFVLTRIPFGKTKEIDAVLNKVRATGIVVHCANELPPPPALPIVLPKLLVDRSRTLSETLNIDCTILLALISDISHSQCPVLDWYPREVCAQIKEEEAEKLLPTHLYPAIGSHSMVCTEEAAAQMHVIVNTLATDTEKARANIMLAQNAYQNISSEQLARAWAEKSDHAVPDGFQLPIRVLPSNVETILERLPKVAEKVAGELSPLNKAIFFYGWAEGLTTLSSNRARTVQMESIINREGLEVGECGPHVWLCGESRSLIAKQGRRK